MGPLATCAGGTTRAAATRHGGLLGVTGAGTAHLSRPNIARRCSARRQNQAGGCTLHGGRFQRLCDRVAKADLGKGRAKGRTYLPSGVDHVLGKGWCERRRGCALRQRAAWASRTTATTTIGRMTIAAAKVSTRLSVWLARPSAAAAIARESRSAPKYRNGGRSGRCRSCMRACCRACVDGRHSVRNYSARHAVSVYRACKDRIQWRGLSRS